LYKGFGFFAYRGHLQALKVRDLKPESIVQFKRLENQSRILK